MGPQGKASWCIRELRALSPPWGPQRSGKTSKGRAACQGHRIVAEPKARYVITSKLRGGREQVCRGPGQASREWPGNHGLDCFSQGSWVLRWFLLFGLILFCIPGKKKNPLLYLPAPYLHAHNLTHSGSEFCRSPAVHSIGLRQMRTQRLGEMKAPPGIYSNAAKAGLGSKRQALRAQRLGFPPPCHSKVALGGHGASTYHTPGARPV